MRKHKNLFVIIISGPTGVGKTTLSKMLSRYFVRTIYIYNQWNVIKPING